MCLVSACRKSETAQAPSPAPDAAKLESLEKALDPLKEQTRLEGAQDAADRAELVTRRPDFRPSAQGARLALRLIPQKTMLRKGEPFWYRAEIENVGSVPVRITDPFIKSGSGGDGWSKFRLEITPSHKKDFIGGSGEPCMFEHPPIPGWERMDEAQRAKAAAAWEFQETHLKGRVNILLQPGEILRTRDWRPVNNAENCAALQSGQVASERPGGLFRQHADSADFSEPGTYRLILRFNEPGLATNATIRRILAAKGRSSEEIEAFVNNKFAPRAMSASSDEVAIEVVP